MVGIAYIEPRENRPVMAMICFLPRSFLKYSESGTANMAQSRIMFEMEKALDVSYQFSLHSSRLCLPSAAALAPSTLLYPKP